MTELKKKILIIYMEKLLLLFTSFNIYVYCAQHCVLTPNLLINLVFLRCQMSNFDSLPTTEVSVLP